MRDATSYYIYDFIKNSEQINKEIVEAKTLLAKNDSESNKEVLKRLNRVKLIISEINANPIFYRKGIGICDPISYPTDILNMVANNMANYSYNEGTFEANVLLKITKKEIGDYETINVYEEVPKNAEVENILTAGLYLTGNQLIIKGYKISLNKGLLISYILKGIDEIGNEKTPLIEVSSIALLKSPIIDPYIKILSFIYDSLKDSNYYVAVGTDAGIMFVSVLFAYLLIMIVLAAIRAKLDGRLITEVLLDEFGTTDVNAQQNLLIGILMLGASVVLGMVYSRPPLDMEFSLEKIMNNVGTDPIGGIVVILAAFGIVFIYLFVEDALKGIIIGKKYYLIGINREENIKMYRKLKEGIKIAKKRINEAEKMNIDVGTEFESILSINQERIEKLLEKKSKRFQKEAYRYIIDGLNKVDGAITSIDGKIEIANNNWHEWERYIGKAVALKDIVPITSLNKIPRQWRMWAVNKYIEEHPEDTLIIDENTIRRLKGKSKADNYIKNLINKDQAIGGVAVARGEIISNKFIKGKISVNTVLSLKLIDYANGLMKTIKDEVEEVEIRGKHNGIGVWSNSEGSILLIIKEKYFDKIKEDIRKKLEGLI